MGGLMDYKARFYSPYINHFTQPDTIVPNPINPQLLNRYSYVGNRPLNFNDPSGHDLVDKIKQKKHAYGKTWKYFSKEWNRDGSLPIFLEKKWSLEDKIQRGSLSGVDVLLAVANAYNINLPRADHWVYEDNIIDKWGGRTYGWAIRSPEENYSTWTAGRLKFKVAYDSFVMISGETIPFCKFNIACVANIMAHEAAHSWIESKIDDTGGWRFIKNQYEVDANEELLADSISVSLFGDPVGRMKEHEADMKAYCTDYNYTCDQYQMRIENAYGIQLPDLAVLISP
jgi:RHS repeat-associated protein